MRPSVREVLQIRGGVPLQGEVAISGAKNSVLGIMAATLLCRGVSTIHNVPHLTDVETMSQLLRVLGAKVQFQSGTLLVDTTHCTYGEIPVHLIKAMRASIYVLGPLLAMTGKAIVPLPGGCAWGPRPVNFHIEGMRALGAQVTLNSGAIEAFASCLRGSEIGFDVPSVGATVNLMMAASLAQGVTRIHNAALEPEIVDLAECLVSMGAKIEGIGTSMLTIEGVSELRPFVHHVIPDRIEAGTLLLAGAITRGSVTITHCRPDHLAALCKVLSASGAKLKIEGHTIHLITKEPLRPCSFVAEPYPCFPTDMQAQMSAYLCTVQGTSRVEDHIYPDRFRHIDELRKLGADIEQDPYGVCIHGGAPLSGAAVQATDLRASAALILAGLAAEGVTEVSGLDHLERGYERLFEKLSDLGARVARLPKLAMPEAHAAEEETSAATHMLKAQMI